jgi:hypothetical protein
MGRHFRSPIATSFSLATLLYAGCGDDTTPADAAVPDAQVELCVPETYPPDPGACGPRSDDYRPDADDAWPPCISDPGPYVPIDPSISTIARVMAFEQIATLLFDPTRDPSADDFLAARALYQEDEGLDSRLVRRYDPHFVVPEGTDCTMPATIAASPDYCVGPARLQPIVLDALNRGIAGETPRIQAARIEGALLWFLYVSTFKESLTCTTVARDCDSSWAYYSGGANARCGLGLSRYVAAVDAHAHDRAWDGALAVRCWRDLDSGEVALDTVLRDRARAQYDRAVLDGVAAVIAQRLDAFAAATGGERDAHWAFLRTLGPVLDREMEARDPGSAGALREELAEIDPARVDVTRARTAITTVFDCP